MEIFFYVLATLLIICLVWDVWQAYKHFTAYTAHGKVMHWRMSIYYLLSALITILIVKI